MTAVLAQPALAALVVWLLMLSINPVGYVGGGSDDGRYLEAARCIVAHHGWCVPTVHWAARWPVVLPLAGAISLFGETRAALGLSSAVWAAAAIVLLTSIVRQWAGATAALIASAALAMTPVFALLSLSPNADLPELTFLLAALFLCTRRRYWTAGLMLGLAIAARETATVALLPVALGCLASRPSTATMLRGASGLVTPLAIEAVWHARTADDAFLRLHLAMAHTRIPSTELAGAVRAGSPLFNVELIRNWRPAMGIRVHWLVDPLLNLLANPACGLTLLAAIALMLVAGRRLPREARLLAAATAIMALALIFALAIDPKPRMFMPAIAAAATIIGIAAPLLWTRHHRAILSVILILLPVKAVATIADQPNMVRGEAMANRWLAIPLPGLVTDEETRSRFAMVPAVRALPLGRGVPRLELEDGPCVARTLRRADIRPADSPWIAAIRSTHLLLGVRKTYSLCIYGTRSRAG